MNNFINLVRNEQVKMYAKKSTWIMIAFLAILTLGNGVITKFFNEEFLPKEYSDNWQAEVTEENETLTQEMESDSFAQFANPMQIEKNKFYLANNIKPQPFDGWQFVYENSLIISVISLFAIIVAAGIVSNEFKWGTIKLLLIRPISRTKILLSKYVSVLVFAFTLLLLLLAFSWIVGVVLFGLNGMSPTFVQELPTGYMEKNIVSEIVKEYGLSMVTLVMMVSFAFMVSTIFRSSGMAIGLSIFLMMAGTAIVSAVSKYEWAKYVLFANTNLTQYLEGYQPAIEGMTMSFSILVLAVYLILFLSASWLSFAKRDVAGN